MIYILLSRFQNALMVTLGGTAWHVHKASQRKDVRLYYGTFNPDKTAYKELLPEWEAAGIKVINVFSDDGHGYIQDAFEKACPSSLLHIFSSMMLDVHEMLAESLSCDVSYNLASNMHTEA